MRYLTEAEAWEVVAQTFAWPEAPKHRCGMCRVVLIMFRYDLISEAMLVRMKARIRKRLGTRRLYFADYISGCDPMRVHIARQFAKAAAAGLVLCWLYPYGWVCCA